MKSLKLSSRQIDGIATVLSDLGQVTEASLVIPFFMDQIDRNQLYLVIWGIPLTLFCWIMSVRLRR